LKVDFLFYFPEDVMLAITNSGAVKIWMLTGYENRVLIII